jgi:hypothetical protein
VEIAILIIVIRMVMSLSNSSVIGQLIFWVQSNLGRNSINYQINVMMVVWSSESCGRYLVSLVSVLGRFGSGRYSWVGVG